MPRGREYIAMSTTVNRSLRCDTFAIIARTVNIQGDGGEFVLWIPLSRRSQHHGYQSPVRFTTGLPPSLCDGWGSRGRRFSVLAVRQHHRDALTTALYRAGWLRAFGLHGAHHLAAIGVTWAPDLFCKTLLNFTINASHLDHHTKSSHHRTKFRV